MRSKYILGSAVCGYNVVKDLLKYFIQIMEI